MELDKKYNAEIIDDTFYILNERHNNIYQFVIQYNDYILSTHDYGEKIPLTMIESHTLTYIEDHPGIKISELATYWNKTKGAISQTVSRLEKWGLVIKEKQNGNLKNIHLYPTEIGVKLSKAHKIYDTTDIAKTMEELKKECSIEEIDNFFKVISVYNKIIKKDFIINKGRKKK
ncbi:MAG: MarR family transcriptional regulator [Fusobacteriaceae bacterium]